MRKRLLRTLSIIFIMLLAACSPQWSHPISEEKIVLPEWVEGLWIDESGDRVIRLKVRDSDFEMSFLYDNFAFFGSAVVTTYNGDYFISVNLKNGKYLSGGGANSLGDIPFSGYLISFIDKISDDEIKVAQIDYEKLLASAAKVEGKVGGNLCNKSPLFIEDLKSPEYFPRGPNRICYLLDTGALIENYANSALERSGTFIKLHRVKSFGTKRIKK